jgi:hypothetical protein
MNLEAANQVALGISSDHADNAALGSVPLVNIDKTPPGLTNCRATDIIDTSAIIRWTTSEPADSQVAFGFIPIHSVTTPLNGTLDTAHAVTLASLRRGATYQQVPAHLSVRPARDAHVALDGGSLAVATA